MGRKGQLLVSAESMHTVTFNSLHSETLSHMTLAVGRPLNTNTYRYYFKINLYDSILLDNNFAIIERSGTNNPPCYNTILVP